MRETNHRDFFGGLVGGFAGILSAALFHPVLFLPSLMAGTLTGFYHRDVILFVFRTKNRATALVRATRARMSRMYEKIRTKANTGSVVCKTLHAVLAGVISGATVPSRTMAWLKAHPMNQATTVHGATILILIAVEMTALTVCMEWI